jgi:uncharacterized RDD family membrane protein YckC
LTPLTTDLSSSPATAPVPSPHPAAWKNEVTARVRAHRSRRISSPENQPALPGLEVALASSSIAARVAERYARVPSYRDVLAAQAAAAEAQAVAAARAAAARATDNPLSQAVAGPCEPPQPQPIPDCPAAQPWQPDLLRYFVSSDSLPAPRLTPAEAIVPSYQTAGIPDLLADPLEDAIVEPALPLPARVLAFPRELIAPRKARPRRAEGPLLEEPSAGHTSPDPIKERVDESDSGELRIFEAEPATPPLDSLEWHSIHLDAEASMPQPKQSARSSVNDLPLHVAPLGHRAMATLVDFSLTLAAFLLFIVVFAASTTHLPSGRVALIGSCAILLAMWVLYQLLFFSLTDGTPGMRYAKIALCTFEDDNPSRAAMRARIAAMLLSALPLGLGFLWSLFDEDTLGWHDRITRTYQRSYRSL